MELNIEIVNKPHTFHSLPEPLPLHIAVSSGLKTLQENDRKLAIEAFIIHAMRFTNIAQFSSSAIVIIDNNILDSMKKACGDGGYHDVNTVASLCFFDFLVNTARFNVMAALTPTILYEYSGRAQYNGRREYECKYRSALSLLGQFGVPICVIGATTYKCTRPLISAIVHDEAEIRKAIHYIKNADWSVQFNTDYGIRIPFSLAIERVPKMSLRYFSREYTDYLLAHLIERLIHENKNNDRKAKKLIDVERVAVFARLSGVKREKVKGLGDIELLSLCDLRAQFSRVEETPRFGLTLDRDLQDVLKKHSAIIMSTGRMAPLDAFARLPDIMAQIHSLNDKMDEKSKEYGKALSSYMNKIIENHFERSAV